jgi:hypothetical protein
MMSFPSVKSVKSVVRILAKRSDFNRLQHRVLPFSPRAGNLHLRSSESICGPEHGWLMKGKTARLLPLLHTLVEERAGERRFPTHPPPFMSQP